MLDVGGSFDSLSLTHSAVADFIAAQNLTYQDIEAVEEHLMFLDIVCVSINDDGLGTAVSAAGPLHNALGTVAVANAPTTDVAVAAVVPDVAAEGTVAASALSEVPVATADVVASVGAPAAPADIGANVVIHAAAATADSGTVADSAPAAPVHVGTVADTAAAATSDVVGTVASVVLDVPPELNTDFGPVAAVETCLEVFSDGMLEQIFS